MAQLNYFQTCLLIMVLIGFSSAARFRDTMGEIGSLCCISNWMKHTHPFVEAIKTHSLGDESEAFDNQYKNWRELKSADLDVQPEDICGGWYFFKCGKHSNCTCGDMYENIEKEKICVGKEGSFCDLSLNLNCVPGFSCQDSPDPRFKICKPGNGVGNLWNESNLVKLFGLILGILCFYPF